VSNDSHHKENFLQKYIFSVDHKIIGLQYGITSLLFLLFGFCLMMVMRWQLAYPETPVPIVGGLLGETGILMPEIYNMLGAMHGTIMIFLGIVPLAVGAFGNYIVPLQIGAPDMAFPKLNAASYWSYFVGGVIMLTSFFMPEGAARSGWTSYPPLSIFETGQTMWLIGMVFLITSSLLGSMNFIVTIVQLRAPGMTWFKLPFFVWAQFVTAFLLVLAFPPLEAAAFLQLMDRVASTSFFLPSGLVYSGATVDVYGSGSPLLWQHLFWFTFHPEVYVLVIPAIGMMYEIIPRFSRRPIFSHSSGVFAFVLLAIVAFASWAHHMFATGMSFTEKTVFMVGTLAAVPASAMHVFNFLATMWNGRIKFATPMMFAVGGIALFFSAGAGGVVNTAMPLDFITHDSYWVVGHFHLFVFGTIAFGTIGFFYYLFPYVTRRMYNEKLGVVHFILSMVGASLTFFTQHLLGLYGMPRRIFDYPEIPEWIAMNQIITIGAMIILVGMGIFLANLIYSTARGKPANMEDPFGLGGKYYYPYSQLNPHHDKAGY